MIVNVKFLGNVQKIDGGRPAIFDRFGSDSRYLDGDDLILVWEHTLEVDDDTPIYRVAEWAWIKMNSDDRPTGQYFRSACIGDVFLLNDLAFSVETFAFKPLNRIPAYEAGLSHAEIKDRM